MVPARPSSCCLAVVGGRCSAASAPTADRGRAGRRRGRRAVGWALGALLFAGAIGRRATRTLGRDHRRAACAALGLAAARAIFRRRRAAPGRRRRATRCRSTPRASRSRSPGSAWPRRRVALVALVFLVLAARRRAPARGREVRRACASCGERGRPAKLVLTVIDGLKPVDAGARGRDGRAPTLEGDRRARRLHRRLRRAFPSVTPVVRGEHRHRRRSRPRTASRG